MNKLYKIINFNLFIISLIFYSNSYGRGIWFYNDSPWRVQVVVERTPPFYWGYDIAPGGKWHYDSTIDARRIYMVPKCDGVWDASREVLISSRIIARSNGHSKVIIKKRTLDNGRTRLLPKIDSGCIKNGGALKKYYNTEWQNGK